MTRICLTLRDAMRRNDAPQFRNAMVKEIRELEGRRAWNVIPRSQVPANRRVLPGTWVMRVKHYPDGSVNKYKARFCDRGDKQIEGVDYYEKYAPVINWNTVRLLLAITQQMGWANWQIDFDNAFVQAVLDTDVYVELPQEFKPPGGGDAVLKLNRSLYGLVQAPLYWYRHLRNGLEACGLKPSDYDRCLYYAPEGDLIILCYVDDCLIFARDNELIEAFLAQLKSKGYDFTPEGTVHAYLGIQVMHRTPVGRQF